jgi:hypothetical protein
VTESTTNAENTLTELGQLVERMEGFGKTAAEHEEKAKNYRGYERELREVIIPNLMESVNQPLLRTHSGEMIELTEQVFAKIPANRKPEAFQWLRDNDEAGMIKEELVTSVHPQTLKAWARGKLKEGVELPHDLFGIYVKKVAKIK